MPEGQHRKLDSSEPATGGPKQEYQEPSTSNGRTRAAFANLLEALASDGIRWRSGLVAASVLAYRQASQWVSQHVTRAADSFRKTGWQGLSTAATALASHFWAGLLAQRGRQRSVPKQPARRILSFVAWSFAFVLILVAGIALWALHDVPFAEIADGSSEPIVTLQAEDGQALMQQGPYKASYAALNEFPPQLVQAVLSIEDRRFSDHWGLDFVGIARAALRNLSAGEVVQGGSTITQQFLKIRYLEQERTFKRKIQEAFLSLWIETRMSKEAILEAY